MLRTGQIAFVDNIHSVPVCDLLCTPSAGRRRRTMFAAIQMGRIKMHKNTEHTLTTHSTQHSTHSDGIKIIRSQVAGRLFASRMRRILVGESARAEKFCNQIAAFYYMVLKVPFRAKRNDLPPSIGSVFGIDSVSSHAQNVDADCFQSYRAEFASRVLHGDERAKSTPTVAVERRRRRHRETPRLVTLTLEFHFARTMACSFIRR